MSADRNVVEEMKTSITPISNGNERAEAYNKKLMMNDDKRWLVFVRVRRLSVASCFCLGF